VKKIKIVKLGLFRTTCVLLVLAGIFLVTSKSIAQENYHEGMNVLKNGDISRARDILKADMIRSFSFTYKIYKSLNKFEDRKKFISLAKPLASINAPHIAYFVASMIGRTPDPGERPNYFHYLDMAHKGGLEIATAHLGSDYYTGRLWDRLDRYKPRRDFRRAVSYFEQCKDVNNDCMEGLGLSLLQLGEKEKAIKALKKADAVVTLWVIYQFGSNGFNKNPKKANSYKSRLDQLYKKDPKSTYLLIREIHTILKFSKLKKGDGDALKEFAFGFRNPNPTGFPLDLELMVKLMKKAVKAKNADAAETLGSFYLEGKNVRRDKVLAYAMYNLVLEWGSEHHKNA
jgi:TPR repeat protein